MNACMSKHCMLLFIHRGAFPSPQALVVAWYFHSGNVLQFSSPPPRFLASAVCSAELLPSGKQATLAPGQERAFLQNRRERWKHTYFLSALPSFPFPAGIFIFSLQGWGLQNTANICYAVTQGQSIPFSDQMQWLPNSNLHSLQLKPLMPPLQESKR